MNVQPPNIIAKTLKKHGIKQFDVLDDLNNHGVHIAKTAFLNIIRYQQWPARINPKEIRNALARHLDGHINQEELENMLNTAPKEVTTAATYKVLSLLDKYSLLQADLRRSMEATGVKLSPSALSQILRHGIWPKTIEQEVIKAAVEKYLHDYVTSNELITMWVELQPKNVNVKNITKPVQKKETSKPILIFEQPEREMLYPNTMQHFNLIKHPFENEVNCIDDLFMSPQQLRVRESMVQAATTGSILAIIGECGAGKTELRKGFYDYVAKNHEELSIIEPMVIDKRRLTAGMIFDALADELNITKLPQSLEHRARKVERALKLSVKGGNRHVLVIEEAHDLSNDAFKHLKRICELSDGFTRLIGVILVGQSELQTKLSLQNFDIREFSYRCNILTMPPLGNEITNYIAHKFSRCGIDFKNVITVDAIEAIKNKLRGVISYGVAKANGSKDMTYPLMVNSLLVKAMNEAASACENVITAELIGELK